MKAAPLASEGGGRRNVAALPADWRNRAGSRSQLTILGFGSISVQAQPGGPSDGRIDVSPALRSPGEVNDSLWVRGTRSLRSGSAPPPGRQLKPRVWKTKM